jgi:hypothetical protein
MTFAKQTIKYYLGGDQVLVSSVEFLLLLLVIQKSTAMHGKPATACPKYHML